MGTTGKYSAMCDEVFNRTRAEGTVVVIYNGDKGNGFSAVGSPDFLLELPKILRLMADQMEAEDKVRQKLLC